MNIGDKIRTLRKERKLTQEQLAEYLGVSSQAVSKWETGLSTPDIDMLPRLAIYFQTTVDALIDFDQKRIEKEIEKIVEESVPLRKNPVDAEKFYRDALEKYPNNEVLLNCLLMTIDNSRKDEKIEIGERLLEYTTDDEIKYDVIRLMAQMYHQTGQDSMAEYYLNQMPELYFMKTEIAASIKTGNARMQEIYRTEDVCYSTLLAMLLMRKQETQDESRLEYYDQLAEEILDIYKRIEANSDKLAKLREEYISGSLLDFYK